MDVTEDGFLGGRVLVKQPRKGFRSGADAVLLAASVPASSGQSVLELGMGVGVASLCLDARVAGLALTGLEIQTDYADLARKNFVACGVSAKVFQGDVNAPPKALSAATFDHVMMNPPYYRSGDWMVSANQDRAAALGEETAALAVWCDAATRRLKPGGWLSVIQKAARLADLIRALDDRVGSLQIKPIAPRPGRKAELAIVRARKGGKADPQLFAPLILHAETSHLSDGADPSDAASDILRFGKNLEF